MTFDRRHGLQRQACGLAISCYQARRPEFYAAEIANDTHNDIRQSKRVYLAQYRTTGSAGRLAVILSQTPSVSRCKSPAHVPCIVITIAQQLHESACIFLAVNVMGIRYKTAQLFSQPAFAFFLYRVICVGHK